MSPSAELLPGAWYLPLASQADGAGTVSTRTGVSLLAPLGIGFSTRDECLLDLPAGVLRGMCYDPPPAAACRLVQVAHGRVLLVLLDLRRGMGFGRASGVTLDSHDRALVYVPEGVAWGCRALDDAPAVLSVRSSAEFREAASNGVRWDSFGFDWRTRSPAVADEQLAFPPLRDLDSPF